MLGMKVPTFHVDRESDPFDCASCPPLLSLSSRD
jgi:hypothetical protein